MLWWWRLSNSSEFISTLTGAWLIFESCSSEKNSQSQISFKGQCSSNMLHLCNTVYAQFPGMESCCELTLNDRPLYILSPFVLSWVLWWVKFTLARWKNRVYSLLYLSFLFFFFLSCFFPSFFLSFSSSPSFLSFFNGYCIYRGWRDENTDLIPIMFP